jgi:hypothetical protein
VSGQLLPPEIWEQISAFKQARYSGQIVISLTRGRITGYAVNASFPVAEPEPPKIIELNERQSRVQSRQ